MSGHSKWSTIKRKKGATDAKRSGVFTRLANTIIVAARTNKGLDLAIDHAKKANMPKDKIENAILRGQGKIEGAQVEEVIYEAYGPESVAIIIKCLTDNKNRTVSSLRAVLNKYHGNLANSGAVAYLFELVGSIELPIKQETLDRDNIEEIILESGATDYVEDDEHFIIYTKPKELEEVKKNIEFKSLKIESAKLAMNPKTYTDISDNKKETIIKLLTAIEDNEDVDEVYINADL
ncbi:MAG: hypothetical protein ACD_58C00043G0002 [uncultured bacterium]|nr:MAG: hypothetical protein ACD_58C00043G0002 [uncultured bacterium]